MFDNDKSSKDYFIQQTKAARKERAHEKDKEAAARQIQKKFRIWLNHKNFTAITLKEFDDIFTESVIDNKNKNLKPALEIFELIMKFLTVYKKERDKDRLEKLCRYFIKSLDSDSTIFSYLGVALLRNYSICWIAQTKKILRHCLHDLKYLHPEQPSDSKSILLRLHTLVSFTSTNTWAIMKVSEMNKLKVGMRQLCSNIIRDLINSNLYNALQILLLNGLCKGNISLQSTTLLAITTLSIRPLQLSLMSGKLMQEYLVYIFSIPTLIHHLNSEVNSQCIILLQQHHLFTHIVNFLSSESNLKTLLDFLNGNDALCLLANLIELADLEYDSSNDIYYPTFTYVVTNLLEFCQQYVTVKKSNTTCWHPILGWFEYSEAGFSEEISLVVKKQLSYLWTGNIVTEVMCKTLEKHLNKSDSAVNLQKTVSSVGALCKTFLDFRINRNNVKFYSKLNHVDVQKIFTICSLYYSTLRTLREMKSVILTGLCYKDKNILHNLWLFLETLGPNHGLKVFLDNLNSQNNVESTIFQMLILFCDCMTHFITILDDIEMYEMQDSFKLSDYVSMSYFLNQFLYKLISSNILDTSEILHNPLLISMHTLLMTIYRRDCQKPFCTEEHWLIKDLRMSSFLADIEKGKRGSQILLSKMPHIIPHFERVIMFRKYIREEKLSLGLTDNASSSASTLILIRRWRIVEDGYRQLSMLPPQALKSVIRVRFVNEQGLDEAGIDQDGVFKEFLEETIRRVFDPSLNLFKVTNENRLYPSSTSFIQENHLLLFEFIGRMLGKAVYEGIVVDVPFASFFVSQFCGQASGILYSCLDELASLDEDLYRSLTLVKHYKGNVRDLELTFSLNEEVMGKIVTHELKPGGRILPVTNENKITYIHMMAQFRMYVQIKEQIAAFTKGFRSLIKYDWLSLFSTPEWQRLISGENAPLNLRDLRKYTQYYGGFHDKHRVICWLWDILENDFSETERGLFLKFVTSCSKSPLLGFAHLEPPFSIRCVEVSDDEDTGDTVGSVIRGFFTIRKRDPQYRLPTSSTCFNLLKLPNYKKKSILREKLRYAITSNTGFELS